MIWVGRHLPVGMRWSVSFWWKTSLKAVRFGVMFQI